jgi:hypothetical protein
MTVDLIREGVVNVVVVLVIVDMTVEWLRERGLQQVVEVATGEGCPDETSGVSEGNLVTDSASSCEGRRERRVERKVSLVGASSVCPSAGGTAAPRVSPTP